MRGVARIPEGYSTFSMILHYCRLTACTVWSNLLLWVISWFAYRVPAGSRSQKIGAWQGSKMRMKFEGGEIIAKYWEMFVLLQTPDSMSGQVEIWDWGLLQKNFGQQLVWQQMPTEDLGSRVWGRRGDFRRLAAFSWWNLNAVCHTASWSTKGEREGKLIVRSRQLLWIHHKQHFGSPSVMKMCHQLAPEWVVDAPHHRTCLMHHDKKLRFLEIATQTTSQSQSESILL